MGGLVKVFITALCLGALVAPARASPGAAEARLSGELLLATSPVTYGEEAFLARIAQRTGGSRAPIGLVLSGGSARAFAHIGVLRRLEELGVVPDFIVANSMGSIVGLLYAAGLSPDQIYELVAGTEIAALFEPSLPLRGGILDPRRFSDLVELYVGNPRIEDLPIPILVACEDLVTKREIRLAAGELRAVLEASYALPVYFPPVPYEGHLLVDGGITNLVPLGTAMEYSPYVVVSSTFYDARGLNLRNPLVILNTSIDIGKRRAGVADLQEYPGALWIRCSVESFSFMSFDRLAELEREGYRSADANAAGIGALKAAAYGSPGKRGGEAEEAFARRLVEVRAGSEAALALGYRAWAPFGRAPSQRPAFALKPIVASAAWPGDPFFLNDSLYAGLGAEFRWRALELSLDGGLEWSPYGGPSATMPESDRAIMPSFGGTLRLYASPWLRAEARALASFESLGGPHSLGLYHRSGVEAAFPGPRLSASSFVEGSGIGAGGGATLWTSGLGLGPYRSAGAGESTEAALSAVVGHQYYEPGGLHAPAQLVFAGLSFAAKAASGLAMQLEGRGRFAAQGEGAPLFPSDPFSLARATALTGGRGLVASSIWLGWAPPKAALSLAELLLVRSPRLGAFAEAAWSTDALSDASGPAAAPDGLVAGAGSAGAGIRAYFDLSLIGLKSAGFSAELGWDLGRQEPFARIFIGPAGR